MEREDGPEDRPGVLRELEDEKELLDTAGVGDGQWFGALIPPKNILWIGDGIVASRACADGGWDIGSS